MIQRIQTLFLLLAIGCLALFLLRPLIINTPRPSEKDKAPMVIFKEQKPVTYKGWEIIHRMEISGSYYLVYITLIFAGTAGGILLINIFLFKKRRFQMLLCWFAIIFTVAAAAFVY